MAEVTNRFALCNQMAEQAKASKREAYQGRVWSTDDILDLDDIVYGGKCIFSIARKEFRTLASNPHTKLIDVPMGQLSEGMDVPQTAILNILQDALAGNEQTLTKRQHEAMQAYDEAIHLEKAPVTYVADKLGIRVNSASELLKRAEIRTFSDFVAYVYDSVHKISDWSPTPQQVTTMMKSKPRICAHCGGKTTNGALPLCFECHTRLGSLREEMWTERTRSWLVPEIRRIRNEHRLWAIDQCFLAHYGTVSIEEYEFLADAA